MATQDTTHKDKEREEDQPYYPEDEELGGAMSFLEHLTELRERIIRCLIALFVGMILCFTFAEQILVIIQDTVPEGVTLQALSPAETLITEFKIAFVAGLFIAFPVLFYQVWMFVAPGLYKREKRIVFPMLIASWACFILGGLFCYFVVFRFTLVFLENITPGFINSGWRLSEFVSFMLRFILAFGIVFEEPVLILVLARIGIVTQKMLWNFFPYAIIIMLALSALITPPDPMSQMMCAAPLIILYVGSVLIVRFIEKKQEEEIG